MCIVGVSLNQFVLISGKKRFSEFRTESTSEFADFSSTESNVKPHAFNMQEHGRRLRRQASPSCNSDSSTPKYILFLLDTSGSIGEASFKKVKDALSKLVLLFCKPIKVAVMSFNHEYNLEFCFNCYGNDNSGRSKTANAIKGIQYRSGMTHTGGAAQCACSRILHPSCGLPGTADCIDVVFVTDGKSNDPSREICKEVECLHRRLGVNTYAIGINNYNDDELNCIAKTSNLMKIFKFEDFDEFLNALMMLEERLDFEAISGRGDYACYNA